MSNIILKNIKYVLQEYEKCLKDIEKNAYKMRELVFTGQNYLKLLDTEVLKENELDPQLVIDKFEASFENNVLRMIFFDAPPRYKVYTSADTLKWHNLVYNAINSLQVKPHFEKAFVWFEFYIPHIASLSADTDNRMIKTIIDELVSSHVIPSDTVHHVSFAVIGFASSNEYPKTVVKVTSQLEYYKAITTKPDEEIANKFPVNN